MVMLLQITPEAQLETPSPTEMTRLFQKAAHLKHTTPCLLRVPLSRQQAKHMLRHHTTHSGRASISGNPPERVLGETLLAKCDLFD